MTEETAAKMKELTDRLETGVREVFESERYATFLKAMSKFHRYSARNVLLILLQMPEASCVAGYTTWKKAFDRHVKERERGILIFAPCSVSRRVEEIQHDPVTHTPILDANGDPLKIQTVKKVQSYKAAYVFDVSQTEGRELPTIGIDELTGDAAGYEALLAAIERIAPCPIYFRESQHGEKGCYHQLDQCIYITEGMSQVQTIKTTFHELSHAKLHALKVEDGKIAEAPTKNQSAREVEAESIAYVVCQHFGLDTAEYSFPYVADWSRGKELDELTASLDTIRSTAAEIIDGIEQQCPELFPLAQKEISPRHTASVR